MLINNVKSYLLGIVIFAVVALVNCNEDAKRLYDDLMVNYNRHRRPSSNPSDSLQVSVRVRLSQIIDVVSH